jgi:hypothetical protein
MHASGDWDTLGNYNCQNKINTISAEQLHLSSIIAYQLHNYCDFKALHTFIFHALILYVTSVMLFNLSYATILCFLSISMSV